MAPVPSTLTLTIEQYEALIALARRGRHHGGADLARVSELDAFLRTIEKANNITRYSLWVRWQDPVAPLPPGTDFPKTWPPQLSYFLELLTRPICKQDVLDVVSQRTPKAVNIMVTPDPAATLGWTLIDDYFPAQ